MAGMYACPVSFFLFWVIWWCETGIKPASETQSSHWPFSWWYVDLRQHSLHPHRAGSTVGLTNDPVYPGWPRRKEPHTHTHTHTHTRWRWWLARGGADGYLAPCLHCPGGNEKADSAIGPSDHMDAPVWGHCGRWLCPDGSHTFSRALGEECAPSGQFPTLETRANINTHPQPPPRTSPQIPTIPVRADNEVAAGRGLKQNLWGKCHSTLKCTGWLQPLGISILSLQVWAWHISDRIKKKPKSGSSHDGIGMQWRKGGCVCACAREGLQPRLITL